MIDYKAIADADPGGDLKTAYDALKAMTVSAPAGETKIDLVGIANRFGPATANNVEAAIKAAISANQLGGWVLHAMYGEGLNITHKDMAAQLTALKAAGLTQDSLDKLLSLTQVQTPKFPGLLEGYLQNARQKRVRGEI